jgi:DNA polymerase III epsilon subunit-like protein
MSWTSIENLEKIKNKKVLFIDLETTGLVNNVKKNNTEQEKRYPNYKNNEDYDSSRIVQFGYIYFENFDYDYDIQPVNIKNKIIKPENFIIPEETIKIHGITNEIANKKGIEIIEVLKKLKKIVVETEYIIGYNIFFDINILMNEFNRTGLKKPITRLKELIKEEKILCVGELSKQYKCYKNMPSQKQIYKELFEKPIDNIHNAQYDIYATIKIMYWYYENKDKFINKIENNIMQNIQKVNMDNMEENYDQTWTDEEYKLLHEEIKENKNIDDICKNHKRSFGGIKGGIRRLLKNKNDKEIINYYENIINLNIDFIEKKEENLDIKLPKSEYIEKNNLPKASNVGSKWNEEEFKNLIKEIEEKEPINIICRNHGRNKGGIKCAIKRLIDEKKILYTEELKKRYSIKYKKEENLDEKELDEDNEIISLLVKKIESLKNKNKILKEEIEILRNEKSVNN